MTRLHVLAVPLLLTCIAAQAASPEAAKADRLVARWTKAGAPGGALAVYKDGRTIYRKGFGLANLEHKVRNTPATPFHVASVSKQFTAFAIHLLADDGKLSLDDDVRKYVPELQDMGSTITLRHLLHHTSGLRDQWGLLALAGWRLEDVITDDDVMRLVSRQQALNFAPGTRFSYSNTGYMLLARVVERVSGRSLGQFTRERIFDPLGMKHTHFQERYGTVVPGRAASYEADGEGGYRYIALSYSTVGPSSLSTTVDDLARWEANFLKPVVGTVDTLARMEQGVTLANGRQLNYASGIAHGSYRGLPTISHSGADAAFRSVLLRFPKQRLAVALLSNDAGTQAEERAKEVAEIYLGAAMAPHTNASTRAPAHAAAAALPSANQLAAFTGRYGSRQITLNFLVDNGRLHAQSPEVPRTELKAVGERSFHSEKHNARMEFETPGPDGVVAGGTLTMNGGEIPLRRLADEALDEQASRRYVGDYYSDELRVLYAVSYRDGKLLVDHPRGRDELAPLKQGSFAAGYPLGDIEFQCVAAACHGFVLSHDRLRNLQFSKVDIAGKLLPARQDRAQLFATVPLYLRGSMNGWAMRDRLQPAVDGKRLEATLLLEAGRHEFKIGSADYSKIDLGGKLQAPQAHAGQALQLAEQGGNLQLEVPARAVYRFALDVADPAAPSLLVELAPVAAR
ncbi:serine hydrolase [Pseudoduganella sp. OTU4001]|uniref:serine hydrolase n=1 Tax=Pseudoduganella sp. OTU4001 TaxID=3043854 RepID=UPI00313D5670